MGARGQDMAKGHVLHVIRKTPEERIQMPPGLDQTEQRLWKRIVAAYPASHFKPGDDVLLKRYCEMAVAADREKRMLAKEGNIIKGNNGPKINPRRKLLLQLSDALNQTATKLRLCPSSRLKRTVADQEGGIEPDKKRNARAGLMFGG